MTYDVIGFATIVSLLCPFEEKTPHLITCCALEYVPEYLVEWDGIVAEVERGDIECTNGYIHVIRDVLMKDKDVQVNMASPVMAATAFSYAVLTALTFFAAKVLSS